MMRKNEAQSSPFENSKRRVRPYLFAITVILIAACLRKWPLGALELRIPWVTFYPAVMAAALYGGFFSGILGTVLSTLVVLFWSPTEHPFIDDSGDWLGIAVFSVNGTLISLMSGAMHRAKESATQAKELAVAANQAKSVFLANISHELRTPLNAILGFSNLMRKDPDMTADQVKKLNIIAKSGENLLILINNVLDISKIEAGHMIREDADVNLRQLLYEVESMMSLKIMGKSLHFNIELSPELPENITIDSVKLRQVLINLTANAIKYTEKGEVTIRAKIMDLEAPDRVWLRFEVEDSGIGICSADQEIIFSPFEQSGDQSAREAGTGLGLAICKQFIELMDGNIGVASEPGKGSVFHIEIPVHLPASSTITTPEPLYTQVTGVAAGQQSYRVLIVEDRVENRLLLLSLLEPLGLDLREAVNGREAVEHFLQWHPHLIWMDIRMPVMNGLEATRRIRGYEGGTDTKIIAITAHALEEERIEILEAGCDDFIRKPYRDTEIFASLAKHLGLHFLYGEAEASVATIGEQALAEAQLQTVAPDLIDALRKATVLLDKEQCLTTIGVIGDHDHQLAERLRCMVEKFQFKEILTAIDNLNGNDI